MKMKLSDDLSLPIDACTQAFAWLGRRGSGKSYGATKLAELLYAASAQFVAIDPVGIWHGLRMSADGKGAGLNIPIFGGLRGDIPIEATGGALLADVIVDRGTSAVLDVSQFESDTDKARFAKDFAARFFYRKKSEPSAVHIFIEEAQEFIPQNIQRGEEHMLHAWQRMIRLGRNYGIGVSMISQRPQDVNKKALNQAECLLCFQLTGPQERKAVEGWVSEKGLSDDLGTILPSLAIGHAHVWSPVWLDVNKEVFIAAKETFAAGTTPKVGQRPVAMKPLAPIEMEQIQKDMAATIEKAKADDPKLLRAEIAKLRKQLAERPPGEKIIDRIVEVPVLKNGQLERTEKAQDRLEKYGQKLLEEAAKLRGMIAPAQASRPIPARTVQTVPRQIKRQPKAPIPADAQGRDALGGPEKKILDAIAWLNSIGVDEPEQGAVAFVAGYTVGGGAFNNPRGKLNSLGYVEYLDGDKIRLTESGRSVSSAPTEELTTQKLHEKILGKLPGPEQKILKVLIGCYPDAMVNEDLAAAAGYAIGGAYNNPRGRLRSLGLIEYRREGGVAARLILFPEGAAV